MVEDLSTIGRGMGIFIGDDVSNIPAKMVAVYPFSLAVTMLAARSGLMVNGDAALMGRLA